ncbi:MAG: SAM-dependent methyltransferase [Prochlorococcus sp. SP3034]|nr:SAM-dependent methyltransferase [Prochlorococcus sp. SP3034]|tara:strand:- start:4211 stop:5011 length:801 start_codon:yes stop_codon:yes gene_type:complete
MHVPNNCCNTSGINSEDTNINHKEAIQKRYGAAAIEQEECLCTPVSFNPEYLKIIPKEVIERDYGCADPTKWVKKDDIVLDLGSGSGKNSFICAQIVGKKGKVIGIDQNNDMLKLSRNSLKELTEKIGFENIKFIKGSIEELDALDNNKEPIIKTSSVDIILSNCVLNLVNQKLRRNLLINIKRVLKDKGRIAISDIVSNKKVPIRLQNDPNLWSGCISGAWYEPELISDFKNLGFKNLNFAQRSKEPWKIIEDIEFRTITLTGNL